MTHLITEPYWPSPTTYIVRAMRGSECLTAAAGTPGSVAGVDGVWDAAARCCRYMLARTKKGRK